MVWGGCDGRRPAAGGKALGASVTEGEAAADVLVAWGEVADPGVPAPTVVAFLNRLGFDARGGEVVDHCPLGRPDVQVAEKAHGRHRVGRDARPAAPGRDGVQA